MDKIYKSEARDFAIYGRWNIRAVVDVSTYNYFRNAWSSMAAYHLTRVRCGENWQDRLASMFWLMKRHIPLSGAAPSMNFKGLVTQWIGGKERL